MSNRNDDQAVTSSASLKIRLSEKQTLQYATTVPAAAAGWIGRLPLLIFSATPALLLTLEVVSGVNVWIAFATALLPFLVVIISGHHGQDRPSGGVPAGPRSAGRRAAARSRLLLQSERQR